jgi:hypothetical protein
MLRRLNQSMTNLIRKSYQNSRPLLTTSLPDNFGYNDMMDVIIYNQIIREKWKHHLISALKKRPKLILFNVTQSQRLRHDIPLCSWSEKD